MLNAFKTPLIWDTSIVDAPHTLGQDKKVEEAHSKEYSDLRYLLSFFNAQEPLNSMAEIIVECREELEFLRIRARGPLIAVITCGKTPMFSFCKA
jgi:hypothetical protein